MGAHTSHLTHDFSKCRISLNTIVGIISCNDTALFSVKVAVVMLILMVGFV